MDRKNIDTFYPLSPMQQGMLFHTLYEPESGIYVELLTVTWRGDVDVDAFRRTWQRVVDRHTALRTSFLWEGLKEPIQVVQRQVQVMVYEHDWRDMLAQEQQERMREYTREERERGFDLMKPPLLRLSLVRTSDEVYELVWTHHHLLMDGWSIPLLLKEVFVFYGAYLRGEELQPALPRPYRDYIVWLKKQDMAVAEQYWREKLAGFTAPTPLVADKIVSSGSAEEGQFRDVEVSLSAERTAMLQRLSQEYGLTVNTLIQGAWSLLLSRYSGNDDVVYGSTVSGRPPDLPGVNEIIGLFINTLPVRVHISDESDVISWLQALQVQQVEMRQYEYTPLADIQSWSEVTLGAPLFESLLVFENIPLEDAVEQGRGLDLRDVETESSTNFPLVFVVVPDKEMSLSLQYDTSLFHHETIERMMDHLQAILQGFVTQPKGSLASISMLTEQERIQVTVHGKVDRRRFPSPEHTRAGLGIAYSPPRTPHEETLAEIWASMLGLQQVGIHDNFFELGGDSIKSIQMVGRARKMGLFLSPRQLFEHPTIATLVDLINQDVPDEQEQSIMTGPVALAPTQNWFFDNYAANPHQWNTSMLLEIHGGLEQATLEETARALQIQHDALRLRFEQDGAEWRQHVDDEDQVTPLSFVDLSFVEPAQQRQAIEAKAAELQRGLNVFVGPLFRIAYFDLGRGQPARLLLIFHQLVMDGVSWRILIEDFQTLYRQLDHERTPQMPPKTTSFLSWTQHLRRYAQSPEVRKEMPFWLQMAEIEPTTLPFDDPDGRNTFGVAEHVTVSLGPDHSQILLTQLPAQRGVRANDTLIAALMTVLGRQCGSSELLLEMKGHGREDLFAGVDISHTIGWFTSSFPMVFRLEEGDDPFRQVSSIQKQLQQLPNSGIGYGLLRYLHEDDDVRRQMQTIPRPLISFNYLGSFGQAGEANESTVGPQWSGRWNKFVIQARKTLSQIVPQRIRMAEESVGPEQDPDGERAASIYIVSIVSDNELHVRWLYSHEQYRRETIEQWAGEYVQELISLIERLAQAPTPH